MIRLRWVETRLLSIYIKFPEISNDKYGKLFKSVIRETIIVQLANFIKIRKSLIKEDRVKPIDTCLRSLWEPIMDLKKPIIEFRNQYIAHVQEEDKPFHNIPNDIINKYNAPTSRGNWLFLAGCACSYSDLMYSNFREEWDKSERKYKARMEVHEKRGLISEKKYHQYTKNALEKAQKNLLQKGFLISR
jgi:hypothetical protein